MIHLFKTCMITAFILGLTWSATPGTGSTLHQYTQYRYDMAPEIFVLTSSGWIMAETMKLALTITLQLKDKCGQTLVTRKMETEAFGDSNATRTTAHFWKRVRGKCRHNRNH